MRRRTAAIAGALTAAVAVAAVAVVAVRSGGGVASGRDSRLVAADEAVLDSSTLLVDDRLVVISDEEITLRDPTSLDVIAGIDRPGRVRVGTNPLVIATLWGSGTPAAAYSADGELLWERDDVGNPFAADSNSTVTTMSCEAAHCRVTAIESSGDVLWTAELDGGARPVAIGGGALITFPGERAVEALPPVIVARVAGAEGRDIVRLDPRTGLAATIHTVDDDDSPEVVVTDSSIAVLDDPDTADCVLSIYRHDGEQLASLPGDCTDAGDGADTAYLYTDGARYVWVGAAQVRTVDAATGAETASAAVGDPALTPTPGGTLRATGQGWSLENHDGDEVLDRNWEWIHDVTAAAVVVGREVSTGPFWDREVVHEVAVFDVVDGRLCASQRVPVRPFPIARALTGCRAAVTSAHSGNPSVADNWLLG